MHVARVLYRAKFHGLNGCCNSAKLNSLSELFELVTMNLTAEHELQALHLRNAYKNSDCMPINRASIISNKAEKDTSYSKTREATYTWTCKVASHGKEKWYHMHLRSAFIRGVTWVSAFGGCQQYLPNKIKFCPTKRGVDSSSTQVFANVYYEYASDVVSCEQIFKT
jgi:hypothetical protein